MSLGVQEEVEDIQLDLLEIWLWRAKKRPLSIVVTHRSKDVKDWEPPPDTLDVVLGHSEQWLSVDLNIPEGWLGWLCEVQAKIPLLERLTIRGALERYPYNPEVFSVAPQLRFVAFEIPCYESELGKILLPWSQLTELSITASDMQTCLTVVEQCSNLAHLALHENFAADRRQLDEITIDLDGITSLYISSNARTSSFIDSISAPHLKDLAVCSPWRTSDFLHSLCAFFARSGCAESITRFSFLGYVPSEKEMVWFLSLLHNLSELELDINRDAPSFSNIFINALHSPGPASAHSGSSARRLLPNLVSLRYVGPITLDSHEFLNVLDVRYNVGGTSDAPQLKSVVVRSYDDRSVMEIGCLSQVESLRAQGMKVDMDYIKHTWIR